MKDEVPLPLRAVLSGVKVRKKLRDLSFTYTQRPTYFCLFSQFKVKFIIVARSHVFAAISISNKYLLFAVIDSFDTHVFCNWQSPYFALG